MIPLAVAVASIALVLAAWVRPPVAEANKIAGFEVAEVPVVAGPA